MRARAHEPERHHAGPVTRHPLLACLDAVDDALKDVAGVEPVFMATPDKAAALLASSQLVGRLEEIRLRVLAEADDVADAEGMRDPASWLAHHARLDGGDCRRLLGLARDLAGRGVRLREALRDGAVNLAQAAVINRAVGDLPDWVSNEVRDLATSHLVEEAARFGPRGLRILGRRVLDVVAPEVAEDHERDQLDREERNASRRTFLHTRRNGDGTTDIRARVSDAVAARLLTYLEAFTSPRRDHLDVDEPVASEQPQEARPHPGPPPADPRPEDPQSDGPKSEDPQPPTTPGGRAPDDRRPYDQRLGAAFASLLESVDPKRLPLHGGAATAVMVTIDLESLTKQLEGVGLIGDHPITAAEARRLACTADLIPVVLGTDSEILDLGRAARLFNAAQRRAMAVRDVTCRGEGCDIPAAWCEAHQYAESWATGGHTDFDDGVLLCSFHHHRAHDHHFHRRRQPDGRIRFTRRT